MGNLGTAAPAVIVVLAAALAFLSVAYWRAVGSKKAATEKELARVESVESRLATLREQMLLLGASVQPLTAAMAAALVKSLTHFHKPGDDRLLAKVGPPNTLSDTEEAELRALLKQRTEELGDEISTLEKNSAALLPLIIERTRLELNAPAGVEIALVTIPKAHE